MAWEVFFRWRRGQVQRATFSDRRTARRWAKRVKSRDYPNHDLIHVRRVR